MQREAVEFIIVNGLRVEFDPPVSRVGRLVARLLPPSLVTETVFGVFTK